MNALSFRLSLVLTLVCFARPVVAQQTESLRLDGVYRVQPGLQESTMELVPPNEVKRGQAYFYYHPSLERHVWGIAEGDEAFRYAFGEGTILPTDRLDLRISETLKKQIMERNAPGLLKALELTGDSPSVRLAADGQWELVRAKSGLRIYDVLTGHRWEWHGLNRKAVLHTSGDRWQVVNGRYVPASGPMFFSPGCCSLTRAGSAALVVRTDR